MFENEIVHEPQLAKCSKEPKIEQSLRCVIVKVRKTTRRGGLNCVFGNFFLNVLDNCPQVQSLK